jgi:hypothetical protein
VIKKPRERGGHSPRRAAEPEKIINNDCGVRGMGFDICLFFLISGICFGIKGFLFNTLSRASINLMKKLIK